MILDALLRHLCVVSVFTVLSLVSAVDKGDVESAYDYDYGVDRHSSITSLSHSSSSSSSSSSSAADVELAPRWQHAAVTWRWCYVCSGKSPDRQCELFPQHVTLGPAKVNCTKNYCTAYVRYKLKHYLIEHDRNGKPVAGDALTPDDYEVTSVARECEDAERGNECLVDADELGATCYSSCTTHYCNDETRRPSWRDLLQRRISGAAADDHHVSPQPRPESRSDQGRDHVKEINLYQPADWNDVMGGGRGNYDLPNDVNTTVYLNRLPDTSVGNSTVTSSALCRRCNIGFTVNCVAAVALLLLPSNFRPVPALILSYVR